MSLYDHFDWLVALYADERDRLMRVYEALVGVYNDSQAFWGHNDDAHR